MTTDLVAALMEKLASAVETLAKDARADGHADAVLALGLAREVRAALAPVPAPVPPASPPPPPEQRKVPIYFVRIKPVVPTPGLKLGKPFPEQRREYIRDLHATFGFDAKTG